MAKRRSVSIASLLLVANLALSGAAHAHQIDIGDNRGVDVAMAARGDTPGPGSHGGAVVEKVGP